MGRIPIYASKAPLRRTPMVRPQPDIAVSEAIGGLAETVGAITADWATKKAEVEAESEYANNTVLYKQAIGNNYKVQSEDASIDPDDLVPNYKKSMQESSGSLIWKSKEAQKQFELNKGNFDLAAEQRLNSLGRSRFIANTKAGYETSRKISIENRDKSGGLLALKATQGAFTPDQYKAEKTDLVHDIEMVQAQDALIVNINADLSEFKNVLPEEKNKLIKSAKDSASAEAKRKKTIQQDELKKQQAQLGKDNIEKLHNNTLTWDELVAQKPILTEQQFKGYEHALMTESPEKSDPKVKAELYKRLGLGLLTSTDIMNAYGDLNIPDKKALESAYTTREKNEWGMMIEPNKYQQATKEVDVTLNELVEDGLMSKGDMEEARTNIINRLFKTSKEKNLVDDEILEHKEKLMVPYYKKQLPLLNDERVWNDFMLGKQKESETERGIAEIKIKELEEKVKKEKSSESGKIRVIAPDGREGYIPKTQIEEAKKVGYKVVE